MACVKLAGKGARACYKWGIAVIGGSVCTLNAMAAVGAEWIVRPALDFGALRDNNLTLTTGAKQSVSGFVIAPHVELRRNTETSKTSIKGSAVHTNYSDNAVPDTNEQKVFLTTEKQFSERTTFGLEGDYRRERLLTTVVNQDAGTGNIRDTDVGLLGVRSRRSYRTLQPSWKYLLTERSALRLSYRVTDVSFSSTVGTGLVDYEERLLSVGYSRQLTPRDDFTVTVNDARYEAASAATAESDTQQILFGFVHAYSENVRGNFAIGTSRTDERFGSQRGDSSGAVLSAGFTQRSEISTLDAVVSRDVTPSGVGRSMESDQVRVNWTRKLSEPVDFTLRAHWLRAQVLEGSNASIDREYREIEPGLSWQWAERWETSAAYRYRAQQFDASTDTARSNAVFLGLRRNFF